MGQAAFGAAAAAQWRQEASQVVAEMHAELAGRRAPAAATAEQQEHPDAEQALRRYLVLREALEVPEASAAVRERLERQVDHLLARHASRIVGELNISRVLETLHSDLGERDQLRAHYHDVVTTHTSIAQTYDSLLRAFGPERVPAALRSLRLAINEDMQAPFASADARHLALLVQDLQRVNEMHSVYNGADWLRKAFVSLAQDRVRAEFIGRLLHLVVDGDSDVDTLAGWLEAASDRGDGDGDPDSAARRPGAEARRREAMRRFLHDSVPVWWWKPQAREALFRR
jgi:type III secretion system YopN/LcrE/InvE/MxiC family regulator